MNKYIYFLMLSALTCNCCCGQNVGIGTNSPLARLHVADSLVLFTGQPSSPFSLPAFTGSKFMWIPQRGSLRAGYSDTTWSANLVGSNSVAFGYKTIASGARTFAAGDSSIASGFNSFAAGYHALATGNESMALGNNVEVSGFASMATGLLNVASGSAAVATGYTSLASGDASFTSGYNTKATGHFAFATGHNSYAGARQSFAAGFSDSVYDFFLPSLDGANSAAAFGSLNKVRGPFSFCAGYGNLIDSAGYNSFAMGYSNHAAKNEAVAIGNSCTASGLSSIAMGNAVTASGNYSMAFGLQSISSGDQSTAIGYRVNTNFQKGAFSIGDSDPNNEGITASGSPDQFVARFRNGYYLLTSGNTVRTGVICGNGQNSWSAISDVRLKENFLPVDGESFLNKISMLTLTTWNYRGQDASSFRHYGPMAQDFFSAFGKDEMGTIGCDTLINQQDFLGVNLIAIQALERRTQKIGQLEMENEKLRQELSKLKGQLQELATMIRQNE